MCVGEVYRKHTKVNLIDTNVCGGGISKLTKVNLMDTNVCGGGISKTHSSQPDGYKCVWGRYIENSLKST